MLKTVVTCDRCGKICTGTTYYKIDIIAHDINETKDGRVSTTTAIHNLARTTAQLFTEGKQYCQDCLEDIEDFINGNIHCI